MYRFGLDAADDGRWQALLRYPDLSQTTLRQLIKKGWTPERILAWDDGARPPLGHGEMDATLLPELAGVIRRAKPYCLPLWIKPAQAVALVTYQDPEYPPLLRECADAPALLFVLGRLEVLSRSALAIVGTRKPSLDGIRGSRDFARAFAQAGVIVVSGLARGIDAEAHRACLQAGGETIAVMGTGIDTIYPSKHCGLAREIAEQGALVSEFLPGSGPQRSHFPRRNRTLSGLALGTLVIEAGRPSGTLLTAASAAEQGRDVFCLPWSLYHPGGAGCRYLLGDGAHLALSPDDVLLECGLTPNNRPLAQQLALPVESVDRAVPGAAPISSALSEVVLAGLGDGTHTLDALLSVTGASAAQLKAELTKLELLGMVGLSPKGYQRIR